MLKGGEVMNIFLQSIVYKVRRKVWKRI